MPGGVFKFMTILFQKMDLVSHSGLYLDFKIDCDALRTQDWDCLSYLVSQRFKFQYVHGIPGGGINFERSLRQYRSRDGLYLIADDVLTTGKTMEEHRNFMMKWLEITTNDIVGIVVFSRIETPEWIRPIFKLWEREL
jgi:hypothetical protein